MKKILLSVIALFLYSILYSQTQPKNIIIVVADGLGYNQVKALEYYSSNGNTFSNFPVQYGVSTYPAYSNIITEPKDINYYTGDYHVSRIWTEFTYTDSMKTDAASAGTAIATGFKSGLKTVGVDIDSSSLETILERANTIGKSTGIVTDLPFSQSAVSSFAAHNPNSDNATAIAYDLLIKSKLSVIIGCGNPNYNDNGESITPNYNFISENDWNSIIAGDTVFSTTAKVQDITNDGIADKWTLIQSGTEFLSTTPNNSTRILGIPQVNSSLQAKRTSQALNAGLPRLPQMALLSVEQLSLNSNGFVVVVESGAIDIASTSNNTDLFFESMSTLQATIDTLTSWVVDNSNWDETLIIVTGSYESGYLTSTDFDKNIASPLDLTEGFEVTSNGSGNIPNMKFQSKGQTKLLTPLFAKGAGSQLFQEFADEQDYVYGEFINNTEIGQICFKLLPDPNKIIKKPKNIILMINDGCGLNQIRSANYYTGTTQAYQNFPVTLYHSTYPVITNDGRNLKLSGWNNSYESKLAWTDHVYLRDRRNATCSGASGTAISSGKKTYYYSLGVDIWGNATYSIARHAKQIGKSAGVITNCPVHDATPAVFFANNLTRNEHQDIFKQLIIESQADLLIGTGNPLYGDEGELSTTPDYTKVATQEMWEDIVAGATTYRTPTLSGWTEVQDIDGDQIPDPWTLVQDSTDFANLMTGPTPKRLLGLVKVNSAMQFYRQGINKNEVHFDDLVPEMPELWQLSRVALNQLSQNPEGFFVMIEGDAGDNAGHQNYMGRLIEEQMAFNKAVDSVISWIEQNGGWDENLLIVTGDHETGLLASPDFNTDSIMLNHYDIIDNGVGNLPGFAFYASHHSNQLIPLFAKGAGCEILNQYADEKDFVRGNFLNNSEIGQAMFSLWDGVPCQIINHSPIVVNPIPDVIVTVGVDTTFSIPLSTFFDEEETELSFSVGARPKWVTVDETTLTFSGTPDKAGSKMTAILITDGKTSGAAVTISTTFLIKAIEPTNIENINEQVSLYPNPAITTVQINVPSAKGEINIYNSEGKKMLSKKITSPNESVNIEQFTPGIYTIQIIEAGTITVQKVLIK